MREAGGDEDHDRVGWEVVFLIVVLAAGGLAMFAAVLLVGGVGVPVSIPGSGPIETVNLRPVRVVAGSAAAAGFLAAAWLVAPRRGRRGS